ncbi:MAG TPA: efflux RND transporter periplasmic adaptor subunit [Lentimicrobium sp.]|nr:efflux RND transporter periplasmic adaptor subunit [Lentimicrobium sp.]
MKLNYKLPVLALFVLFLASCGNGNQDKSKQLEDLKKQRSELDAQIHKLETDLNKGKEQAIKTMSVQLTEIKTEPFSHFLEVQGKVDGEDNIGVSAQMPGVVTAIYVKEGDRVSRGQVLAQIESGAMQQQYESAKTQLELATSVYNKQKALWDQQIGSEIQFLTAKTNKESAEKGLAALGQQLEMSKIKSPINGAVEELNLKIGQMAQPGMPAIRVVNFSTVKVVADIAEAYASKVKPGAKVIVSIPDLGKDIEAKVDFTSKYINPVNRTFLTEIRLKPGQIEYRANMIARVKINDYNNPEAMIIPIGVVREAADGKYIYVAENENGKIVAKRRTVEIGQTYNGMAEISKGIKPGDKVITTGYNNLVEGQPLKVS